MNNEDELNDLALKIYLQLAPTNRHALVAPTFDEYNKLLVDKSFELAKVFIDSRREFKNRVFK